MNSLREDFHPRRNWRGWLGAAGAMVVFIGLEWAATHCMEGTW